MYLCEIFCVCLSFSVSTENMQNVHDMIDSRECMWAAVSHPTVLIWYIIWHAGVHLCIHVDPVITPNLNIHKLFTEIHSLALMQ